jgi:D-aspartate ligase
LAVARCLALAGINAFAISPKKFSPLRFSWRKSRFIFQNTENSWSAEEAAQCLIRTARDTEADVYLPVDEDAHRFAILHRTRLEEHLRLPPLPTLEQFDIATDKGLLSEFLASHSIPCPLTRYLDDWPTDSGTFVESCFPVLAKPVKGHGGAGIVVLRDINELQRFADATPLELKRSYIVQQFIRGYDIDCSVLSASGRILAYTIQKSVEARSRPFAAPGGIEFLYDQKVYDVVAKLIADLQFSGIAHIDLRFDSDDNDFKVIEINPRYWGSLTGSLMAGVNFPFLACMSALKESYPVPVYEKIRYIDVVSFIKGLGRRWIGASQCKFHLRETDFQFVFADPIAEIANAIMRRQTDVGVR